MAKFVLTSNYEKILSRIEDYIFSTTQSLQSVGAFLDEHDKVLTFLAENPRTPAVHPVTGDQSWNFDDGRYRLFFRCGKANDEVVIYLIHLVDNKQINLDVYPDNKIPTYYED